MNIRYAQGSDVDELIRYDKHISRNEAEISVELKRVYIAEDNGRFIGWLRYNMFWDSIPFMNMLYIFENYRGKGVGRHMALLWETDMAKRGYKTLMTSTQSNESAQGFYYRLGYECIGGFRLEGEFYEMILSKDVGGK